MNTQKVAITIPKELIIMIDTISKQQGLSRSRYISNVLQEKLLKEQNRELKAAYDRIFSDTEIQTEQRSTSIEFEGAGSAEGQEFNSF